MQRYPLSWPDGWKRIAPSSRKRGKFNRKESRQRSSGGSYTVIG